MQKTFTVEEINNYLSLFSEIVIPHATEEAIVKANRIKRYISRDVKFNHPANIHVGDEIIVVDGSFMTDSKGNSVHGIYFMKNGEFEVLVVEQINHSYPTEYGFPSVLGYHNNCKIRGYDGNTYYCSLINIKRIN